MNKKILLISSVLLTLSLVTIIFFNNVDNKENNIISNINKNEQVINSNMITMMYETESGSGEYVETKDTTWPESGYIFNENLSGCENGGELEYNSENNTVNLLSNSSDQCYVYFDKYDGVWIDNVSVTNVTGSSVILDVSATSENGNITTYYYSLNDSEYISTSTNPIVIENLNQLTEYNIKIYAVDSTSARSNIYKLNVSTTDISVPVINSVEVSDITTSGFTLTVNATSDVKISKYYFMIDSENLAGVNSENRYTFDNLNLGTSYNITVYAKDINGVLSNEYSLTISTADGILLANYIKSLYITQGSNGIYYHTSSLANSAGDNSYRYSGANPNNYVCFGTTAEICPTDNRYRIIGVFDNEVKLIKSTSIGTYYWNSNGVNTWSNSPLNIDVLNNSYLNSFDDNWKDIITVHDWEVGGGGFNYIYNATPQTSYNYEIVNNNTIYSAKIGLMYVSDYGFATLNTHWTTLLNDYTSATDDNWLYFGKTSWTITPNSSDSSTVYLAQTRIGASGCRFEPYDTNPAFYLNSDVLYDSGDGSQENPFRIK